MKPTHHDDDTFLLRTILLIALLIIAYNIGVVKGGKKCNTTSKYSPTNIPATAY